MATLLPTIASITILGLCSYTGAPLLGILYVGCIILAGELVK